MLNESVVICGFGLCQVMLNLKGLKSLELERHIETEHDPSGPKCKNCDFVASDGKLSTWELK